MIIFFGIDDFLSTISMNLCGSNFLSMLRFFFMIMQRWYWLSISF